MTAGRLVSEAPGAPATTGTTDTFAVALVGEEDRGWLVDPGGVDAGLRCMIEVDADESGFVLEAGCGYRPAAGGPGLD